MENINQSEYDRIEFTKEYANIINNLFVKFKDFKVDPNKYYEIKSIIDNEFQLGIKFKEPICGQIVGFNILKPIECAYEKDTDDIYITGDCGYVFILKKAKEKMENLDDEVITKISGKKLTIPEFANDSINNQKTDFNDAIKESCENVNPDADYYGSYKKRQLLNVATQIYCKQIELHNNIGPFVFDKNSKNRSINLIDTSIEAAKLLIEKCNEQD